MRNCAIAAMTVSLGAAVCATSETFEVTGKNVPPGSQITWLGEPTALRGEGGSKTGAALPALPLTGLDMKPASIGTPGKVRVIVTLPSVDTPVCDAQTHLLGETPDLAPAVERIAISADLPYAQRRFAELDLDAKTFGKSHDLLARTLAGGKHLSRPELVPIFKRAGISPAGQRRAKNQFWRVCLRAG